MGTKVLFLVPPNRMMPNMTNFNLIWPMTPNWEEVKFDIGLFWAILRTIRFFLTTEARWCQIRCCRTNRSKEIVEKAQGTIVLDPSTSWPLDPVATWSENAPQFRCSGLKQLNHTFSERQLIGKRHADKKQPNLAGLFIPAFQNICNSQINSRF